MNKKCKDCEYFQCEGRGKDVKFECRRYAPRILHGSGTGWSNQKFAEINPQGDWCGEFKLKE